MLYKYKDLKNFERIVDIILNKRLYAATYKELNDPMEGQYTSSERLSNKIKEQISYDKLELRICSLSKERNEPLMWAHYADGARGIVIGINEEDLECRYDDDCRKVVTYSKDVKKSTEAKKILSCKQKGWEYEQEVRIFSNANEEYINIEIEEIILGSRISEEHKYILEAIKDKARCSFKITKT